MRSASLALLAFAAEILFVDPPASAAVLVTVNKSNQEMTVEVDGVPRWTWPVSTGQLAHDTPSGRFTAFRMEADHFSKEWDDAPMPHSIFFTERGHAIHGYLNTSRIGTPASHGCVRLAPQNAAKLYALVEAQGLSNTKVVLTGDVRVALARRGLPRGRDAAESLAFGDRLDPVSGSAPGYAYPEPQYGRRPDYSAYRSFRSYQPNYSYGQFRQ
jgi:L,D-transpeptidase-like protein